MFWEYTTISPCGSSARRGFGSSGNGIRTQKSHSSPGTREVLREDWDTPSKLKEKYRKASIVANNRVVFNIKGNDYRLVVRINYPARIVYVRFVGTHAEYDAVDVEEV